MHFGKLMLVQRKFSLKCKSEVGVLNYRHPFKNIGVLKHMVIATVYCSKREVPQINQLYWEGFRLYSEILPKLNRVSAKIRKHFSEERLIGILYEYNAFVLNCKRCLSVKSSGLFKLLIDPNFLIYVYRGIRIRGISNFPMKATLGGIVYLAESIRLGTYCCAKRLFVNSRNFYSDKFEFNHLSEVIIQQAIILLLGPIYEYRFLNVSFGFRYRRNVFSCLSRIRSTTKSPI